MLEIIHSDFFNNNDETKKQDSYSAINKQIQLRCVFILQI